MDRVDFIESVSGIKYPGMIVDFFDHFIALKQIVEDSGKVNVLSNDNTSITFSILFSSIDAKNLALNTINSLGGHIAIYGRPISIYVEVLTDLELKISLK